MTFLFFSLLSIKNQKGLLKIIEAKIDNVSLQRNESKEKKCGEKGQEEIKK